MSDSAQLKLFEGENPLFEQQCRKNGTASWSAREFAAHLGYKDYNAFFKSAINKAQQVLFTLRVDVAEHFQQEKVVHDGVMVDDVRMSRFACYLAAMHADSKKEQVAKAKVYFAGLAELVQQYSQEAEDIERISIREDIGEQNDALCSTAKKAGVENYAFFMNAGYLGLYCMNINRLKELKDIPTKRSPLDFMGKTESAANLFRLTQTEERIKQTRVRGQSALEQTAHTVGRDVRSFMLKHSGKKPEDLPRGEDIRLVQRKLKATGKGLQRIDATRPVKRLPKPSAKAQVEEE